MTVVVPCFQFIDRVGHSCDVFSVQTVQTTSSFPGVALGPVIDILLLCSATCTALGCQGRPHPCRGAEDVSLVLVVQKTTRFPSCSPLIDVDVTVGQVQQIPRVLSV